MTSPPGWRLRHYPSVGSTSDICAALAVAGEPGGLAVRADRQTAARGSRGRDWATLPGNIAVSVLLRPTGPARDAGQWALLAAVAFREALAAPGLALKWPNDVLLDGKKLGGVLIDTALNPAGGLDWLVIGFGANLGAVPALDRPAASLPGEPAAIAATLLVRLDHWPRIRHLEGFGAIRCAWLGHGPSQGDRLRLRHGGAEVGGTFARLDDQGALLLQSGGRIHAFQTGDVLLGSS